MSRGHRTCEICGIQEKRCSGKVFFARFPLREHECKLWLKVVGKEDLVLLPIEKLHDLRYVCGNHFEKRAFTKTKTRLKKGAIPKLHLKMPPLSDELLEGFPLHMARRTQAPVEEASVPPVLTNLMALPAQESENVASEGIKTIVINEAAPVEEAPVPPVLTNLMAQESEMVAIEGIKTIVINEAAPVEEAPVPPVLTNLMAQESEMVAIEGIKTIVINEAAPVEEAPVPPVLTNLMAQESEMVAIEGIKTIVINEAAPVEAAPVLPVLNNLMAIPALKSENIKSSIGIKRRLIDEAELTPRKKKLVDDLRKTRCTLRSLRKSASLVERIESPILKEIVLNATKNQKRKPKGRRWTVKNKVSALAIFKRSPRTYRFLSQVLPLPSEKTLQNILKKVPIEPGINKTVLLHLSKIAPKKDVKDKVCCLLFDEMAIKPRLILNTGIDCIEGFEDLGELGRKERIADHALVFMLQGLRQKFKQPIAFYFTKGTISSQNLAVIIKNIITKVTACGFRVLNTVCDQGPTNMGALKILRKASGPLEDGSNHYFVLDDKKVFIIFDVPHLFKSIRNNFLNNGTMMFEGKQGRWAHLVQVEKENNSFLYLSKITEAHVNPKYKTKMRVKYAAQILSNTVSAVLKLLSRAENDDVRKDQLLQTAHVIQGLDKLLDLTNGPSGPKDKKKNIRENVSQKTNHYNAWTEYIKKMNTVTFSKDGKTAKNVKCVEGYITTLKSLKDIWNFVNILGYKYLNLRQLNQDALENLFGLLRQQSPTNRHPTAAHFISALKTAVVTKKCTGPIRGTNCEKDDLTLLTGFENVVFNEVEENKENEADKNKNENKKLVALPGVAEFPVISIPEFSQEQDEVIEEEIMKISGHAVVYVSGYLASRIIKNSTCHKCKSCLRVENPTDSMYDYTTLREWWQDKCSLTYPTIELCKMVQTATEVVENELINTLYEKNITQLTITLFGVKCDFAWFSCHEHANGILELLCKKLALLLIRRACHKINIQYALQEVSLADSCKKAEQQGKVK